MLLCFLLLEGEEECTGEGSKIFLVSGFGVLLNCYPVLGLCPSHPKAVYPKGLPQSQGWEAWIGRQVELDPTQGTGFYIG